MDDTFTLCFCTSASQGKVKEKIRESMKPTDDITKESVMAIHKSLAGDDFCMGRCLGCFDEVEDLVEDYKQGKWT